MPMDPERFLIALADDSPFRLTVGWWHNALVTRRRLVGGAAVDATAWYKHLSHGGRGWFDRVRYGTLFNQPQGYGGRCADPQLEQHDGRGHQPAVICCRASRLLVVDVDDPAAYAQGRVSQLLTAAHASARRGAGWHTYVAVPEALLDGWPRQGPIPGGDLKASGFVPLPGCYHYSGEPYEPVPDSAIQVATADLLAALAADRSQRDSQRVAGAGDGGDRGDGNEPTLFTFTGALVAAGWDRATAWERWLSHAQTLTLGDPSWPWTAADEDVFDRQWTYCRARHAAQHAAAPAGGAVEAPVATLAGAAPAQLAGQAAAASGGERLSAAAGAGGAASQGGAGPGEPPPGDIGDPWAGELPPVAPSPEDPLAVARYLAGGWRHPDGVLTRAHWRDTWLRWVGTHWAAQPERVVRNEVYLALEDKVWEPPPRANGEPRPLRAWQPTSRKVGDVVDAVKAVTWLAEAAEPDTWLAPRRGALLGEWSHLVPCRNALVDPATRTVIPHSPRYLNTHVLPFDWDPQARCPRWEAFLGEVFPGDAESVALLQEWFGYVLSGRTNLQKMLFAVGASRSGKGVTARVLTQLLDRTHVAAPTLSSFGTNFGLSSLVGKPLAIIGDARSSARVDTQAVIERLLSITGEDRLDIDRKNREIWTGTLGTRVMMLSNELPWFRDASGAVAKRLLVLVYRHSFLGREDLHLEAALAGELAGVLNWALDGLARLNAAGRFTAPAASAGAAAEIDEQTSPIRAFLATRCRVGAGHQVAVDDLFAAWVAWCVAADVAPGTRQLFGSHLRAGLPTVDKRQVSVPGRGRVTHYLGVALAAGPPRAEG